jgi:hypothetical protein
MTQSLFNKLFNAMLDMNIKYGEDTLPIAEELADMYPSYMECYNTNLPDDTDYENIQISTLQMQLLEIKVRKAIKKTES